MATDKLNEYYIEQFLLTVRDGLARSQEAKGLKASGKSIESIQIETGRNVGRIIDPEDLFKYQDTPGRGPGKGPGPSGTLMRIIYNWLAHQKYGLSWATEGERKTLAFLVSRKIHRYGTYIHINNKQTHVLDDAINMQKLDELAETLAQKYGEILGNVIAKSLLDQRNLSEAETVFLTN